MDKEKDSGIMELVAIAALLFLFWKFYIKKKEIPEPATTPAELKDQFARDPNFNLNDYCKDVIYRPLSSSDLSPSNLLGEGWCYRGDRSAIDESKGFGDAYAEKQADNYQSMKEEEAVFVTNKSCIQFRLINSTASPITTDVLDSTTDAMPFLPPPSAPVANNATFIQTSRFTANWLATSGATGYYLDVATDSSFTSYVSGYQNLDVSNNLSYAVTGLTDSTSYYYRVRAYNTVTGDNSNIVSVVTSAQLISSWTNYITRPWDTFISVGRNILSAIEAAGTFGEARSNNFSANNGDTIRISYVLTKNSGANPTLDLFKGGVPYQSATTLVGSSYIQFVVSTPSGSDYQLNLQSSNTGTDCVFTVTEVRIE